MTEPVCIHCKGKGMTLFTAPGSEPEIYLVCQTCSPKKRAEPIWDGDWPPITRAELHEAIVTAGFPYDMIDGRLIYGGDGVPYEVYEAAAKRLAAWVLTRMADPIKLPCPF